MNDKTDRLVFVNTDGDHLADYTLEETREATEVFVLGLLERLGNRTQVEEFVAGLTLVEEIPAALILGVTVRALVNDVLAHLKDVEEVRIFLGLFMATLKNSANE